MSLMLLTFATLEITLLRAATSSTLLLELILRKKLTLYMNAEGKASWCRHCSTMTNCMQTVARSIHGATFKHVAASSFEVFVLL